MENGPFGIALLNPQQLFGLTRLDNITHAMIWSMIANIGAYVMVSLWGTQSADEHRQASLFVDVFKQGGDRDEARFWRGTASVPDLYQLLTRFVGSASAESCNQRLQAVERIGRPGKSAGGGCRIRPLH